MTELKVFDAPAGSGKSTEIKTRAVEWSERFPESRLLCVTFTNRASEELRSGISASNVQVSTIHSFLVDFMKPFFRLPEIVNLFFDIYQDDIQERIVNSKGSATIEESNARYQDLLGAPLTVELISSSVSSLHYNEMQYNSLFSGGLSHDSLLSFANRCIDKFPAIGQRLRSTYKQIIIDEYQDTDAEVLEFFLKAVKNSETSLHLYGDPMQQIYQDDTIRQTQIMAHFGSDERIITNYRSTRPIVNTLNLIYNDPSVVQEAHDASDAEPPRIHLSDSPENAVESLRSSGSLILTVANAKLLHGINAKGFFDAVQKIPEHKYTARYPALAMLTEPSWIDINNDLVKTLYAFIELEQLFLSGRIGEVVQRLNKHRQIFGIRSIEGHLDKRRLGEELEEIFELLGEADTTVRSMLSFLVNEGYKSKESVSVYLENEDYAALLEVEISEVRNLYNFRLNPEWSTQHGVKGESHDSVLFVADDARPPISIQIYRLFNLWPKLPLSLPALKTFQFEISKRFLEARQRADTFYSDQRKHNYDLVAEVITSEATAVAREFSSSTLFADLYGGDFTSYLEKPNTTNAKRLFKVSTIESLLTTYRLFYVGCSRARRDLDVIVDKGQIKDVDGFRKKFRELGFLVMDHA